MKIASLIKEAFTDILNREGKDIYGKAFVTVTRATITSDLTLARFYLSIFNAEDADEVLKKFNTHKFELKRHLAEKLRFQLRRMPEIEFYRDETMDYVSKMEEVFKKINEEDIALQNSKVQVKAKTKRTITKKAKGK